MTDIKHGATDMTRHGSIDLTPKMRYYSTHQICPFARGQIYNNCLKHDCAIWDPEMQACALYSIMANLDSISNSLVQFLEYVHSLMVKTEKQAQG